ncbi:MAG TPA: type II secretion system F family protein [Dehalococcoidia bacterium]|nr:type II secretion system F family protein [Dehalococcoidia bacterium]
MLVMWYARSRSQHEVRLRSLMEPQRMLVEHSDPFSQRVAFPVVNGLVNLLMSVLPTSLIARSRQWLLTAGDKTSISQFMTMVLIAGTAAPAGVFVLMWVFSGGAPSGAMFLLLPVVAVMAVGFSFLMLKRTARKRQEVIWKSLPNALDLLTTCVEAGLSLDFGLQRVADKYPGPLSDEIMRVLREMGLGRPRREALNDMAARIALPDVATFINSIVQAEMLGTSVGQVLRVQAQQMRMRRRQRAEQVAHQAPVKMVVPLVLFLMPSLFIVTIGPVILNVIKAFQEN